MNHFKIIDDQKADLNILFAGDLCPMGQIERACIDDTQNKICNNFREYFENKDLFIANLEGPLTKSDNKAKKSGPNLKADPISFKMIRECGIDILNLANNHIMDYGRTGLNDSINLIKKNNLLFLGAGDTIEQASMPLRVIKNGVRITFLAFCENVFNIASTDQPGCAPINQEEIIRSLQNEQQHADLIIISLHAGPEYFPLPTPRIKLLCRNLTNYGVSAIICHHSHVIASYEVYNSVPIFYGLGNFLFDTSKSKSSGLNYKGVMVKIGFNKKKALNYELKPFVFDKAKTSLVNLNETESSDFIARMGQLCEVTENAHLSNMIWLLYSSEKYKYYYAPNLRRYRSSIFLSKETKNKTLLAFRKHESTAEVIEEALYQLVYGIPEIEPEARSLYENLISDVTFLTKIKRIVKFFV